MKKLSIIILVLLWVTSAWGGWILDNGSGGVDDSVVIEWNALDNNGNFYLATWDSVYICQIYHGVDSSYIFWDTLTTGYSNFDYTSPNGTGYAGKFFRHRRLSSTSSSVGAYGVKVIAIEGSVAHTLSEMNYYVNDVGVGDFVTVNDSIYGVKSPANYKADVSGVSTFDHTSDKVLLKDSTAGDVSYIANNQSAYKANVSAVALEASLFDGNLNLSNTTGDLDSSKFTAAYYAAIQDSMALHAATYKATGFSTHSANDVRDAIKDDCSVAGTGIDSIIYSYVISGSREDQFKSVGDTNNTDTDIAAIKLKTDSLLFGDSLGYLFVDIKAVEETTIVAKAGSLYVANAGGFTMAELCSTVIKYANYSDWAENDSAMFAWLLFNAGDTTGYIYNGEIVVQDTTDNGDTLAMKKDSSVFQGSGTAINYQKVADSTWLRALSSGTRNVDSLEYLAEKAIKAISIDSDAIGAAKIADGAIDSATFAAGAITKSAHDSTFFNMIQDTVWTANKNTYTDTDWMGGSIGFIRSYTDGVGTDGIEQEILDNLNAIGNLHDFDHTAEYVIPIDSTFGGKEISSFDPLTHPVVIRDTMSTGDKVSFFDPAATPVIARDTVSTGDTLAVKEDSLVYQGGGNTDYSPSAWDATDSGVVENIIWDTDTTGHYTAGQYGYEAVQGGGGSCDLGDSIKWIWLSLGFEANPEIPGPDDWKSLHEKIGDWYPSSGITILDKIAAMDGYVGSEPETLIVLDDKGGGLKVQYAKITIKTSDGLDDVVPGVYADVNGVKVVALDSAVYTVYLTHDSYIRDIDTFTVESGGGTDTLWMTEFDPGSPTDSAKCRVSGYVEDAGGNRIKGANISAGIPDDYWPIYHDDAAIKISIITGISDADGFWYIDLYPNINLSDTTSRYIIVAKHSGVEIFNREINVPNDSTWALPAE